MGIYRISARIETLPKIGLESVSDRHLDVIFRFEILDLILNLHFTKSMKTVIMKQEARLDLQKDSAENLNARH